MTGIQAITKVPKQHKNPLKAREIFDALEKKIYKWNFEFPLVGLYYYLATLNLKTCLETENLFGTQSLQHTCGVAAAGWTAEGSHAKG